MLTVPGTVKRYVYYHCTQFQDFYCREPYIREEKLAEALADLLGRVTLQEIESKEALRYEVDKFRRLSSAVLGYKDSEEQPELNLHNFAKYVLTEGTRAEKRTLILCLNETLYLKNKKIIASSG